MIPVDLRRHTKDAKNWIGNFSNPIFLDVCKGTNWQAIYSDISQQLSNQNELRMGKFDRYLQLIPYPLLRFFFKYLLRYQNKKKKYLISGLLSSLSIDLQTFNARNNSALDGYFLPINLPLAPITVVTTEHKDAVTICFSVSNALASQDHCQKLLERMKGLIKKETTSSAVVHPVPNDVYKPHYNKTNIDFSKKQSIISMIWNSFVAYADNTALITENQQTISYRQLQHRVMGIAHYFLSMGIKENDTVALLLPRSQDSISAMLACWYIGVAYLPLDINYPLSRMIDILDDAKPALLIHDHLLQVDDLPKCYRVGMLPKKNVFKEPPTIRHRSLKQLAYLIYTSGSTGKPKGVMISHEQLQNYLLWARGCYRVDQTPYHTALFTSLAFDLTVTSLYLPLLTGGSLSIIDQQDMPLMWQELLQNKTINFLKLTPSHLRLINHFPIDRQDAITLVVGGEALPCQLAKTIHEKMPNAKIFNEYGPTETTVGCMVHLYNPEKDIAGTVPIGRPIANTRIYCLNEQLKPIGFPSSGEIYIAGRNVGLGYLGRMDENKEKFSADPFCPGERMYKSGDIACYQDDGLLIYLGRQDGQMKIRGYRIELTEIENALLALENVSDAVVVAKKIKQSKEENKVIIAYLVLKKPLDPVHIRNKLSETLPAYMLPNHFEFLEQLPITTNGKMDHRCLSR